MNTPATPAPDADTTPRVYISIHSPEGSSNSTVVRLSDGQSLGHVQAVTWHAEVGSIATCTVRTIMTPAELVALKADTTVKIVLWDEAVDGAEAARHAPIVKRIEIPPGEDPLGDVIAWASARPTKESHP